MYILRNIYKHTFRAYTNTRSEHIQTHVQSIYKHTFRAVCNTVKPHHFRTSTPCLKSKSNQKAVGTVHLTSGSSETLHSSWKDRRLEASHQLCERNASTFSYLHIQTNTHFVCKAVKLHHFISQLLDHAESHRLCSHGLESRSERCFGTWFGPFLIWKPDFSPCESKAVSNQAFETRFQMR